MPEKTLSEKERLFCAFYVSLRNAGEAARAAGFRLNPRAKGQSLLLRPEIRREIRRRERGERLWEEAVSGLRRLAFGSVNDAVLLAAPDREGKSAEALDLFSVSEIKQSKPGQIEIKFFDRFKALEALLALAERREETQTRDFFEALNAAAARRKEPNPSEREEREAEI